MYYSEIFSSLLKNVEYHEYQYLIINIQDTYVILNILFIIGLHEVKKCLRTLCTSVKKCMFACSGRGQPATERLQQQEKEN